MQDLEKSAGHKEVRTGTPGNHFTNHLSLLFHVLFWFNDLAVAVTDTNSRLVQFFLLISLSLYLLISSYFKPFTVCNKVGHVNLQHDACNMNTCYTLYTLYTILYNVHCTQFIIVSSLLSSNYNFSFLFSEAIIPQHCFAVLHCIIVLDWVN